MKIVGLATFVILGGILTVLILNWTHVIELKYLEKMGMASLVFIGISLVCIISWITNKSEETTNILDQAMKKSTLSLLFAFISLVIACVLTTVDRLSNLSSIDIIDFVAWGLILVLVCGQVAIVKSEQISVYSVPVFDFSIVFAFFLCNVLLLLRNLGIDVIVKKRED